MKLMGFDRVLILSPHPDDTEFSMAGTILGHKDTLFTSVVFSTGSENDPVTDESRWAECREYWCGKKNLELAFMSQFLGDHTEEEWINIIEKHFTLDSYDALFIPPVLDTHYEHRFVHGIGMALTRSKSFSVLEYKSASALDTWIPNLFVPVEEVAKEKVELLAKFESQQKRYLKPDYMKAYHSHINSMKKGYNEVEQFRAITVYQ